MNRKLCGALEGETATALAMPSLPGRADAKLSGNVATFDRGKASSGWRAPGLFPTGSAGDTLDRAREPLTGVAKNSGGVETDNILLTVKP